MAKVTMNPPVERIRKWLEKIASPEAKRRILTQGTLELADRARAYPSEGPWNRNPGTRGKGIWYERQFGTRWMRKGGSIGGKPYFQGLGGRNTSEMLQKNWFTEVRADVGSVFTGVSYAPLLFDPAQRVSWAAGHGWKTVDEIADGYAPRFVEITLAEIDRRINTPI
jgi:hypothetical protein